MKTEFGFLANLKNKYDLTKIGDDCAVLPKDSKTDSVITTDLLVEDIDFRLSWTKPEFLGHKSLAVSLSDIAAMGAKPVWSMISIGVPETIWKTDFVDKFYDGYMRLAQKFGVELIGGDVSKTPDKIVIDSIVSGEVKRGKAILRSNAQVNDLIYVTGNLGGASLALKLLENGENFDDSEYQNLLLKQLAPNPQIEIGNILQNENLATSMIDLSDGISSDLFHICSASKVGAKIFQENLPIASEILESKNEIENKFSLALNGGEDFELLFTVDPKKKFQLENALKNYQISLIGEITANAEIIELIRNSKTEILTPKGFQHFA
ncbi:MAG TPA: thiamine-phosphate kinase [Pyrinomonadaceae bacterium]|nr:thiamine-phosphate kinase [Pyrinomonadaceae bacterium]